MHWQITVHLFHLRHEIWILFILSFLFNYWYKHNISFLFNYWYKHNSQVLRRFNHIPFVFGRKIRLALPYELNWLHHPSPADGDKIPFKSKYHWLKEFQPFPPPLSLSLLVKQVQTNYEFRVLREATSIKYNFLPNSTKMIFIHLCLLHPLQSLLYFSAFTVIITFNLPYCIKIVHIELKE